jgi:hypothetical protein
VNTLKKLPKHIIAHNDKISVSKNNGMKKLWAPLEGIQGELVHTYTKKEEGILDVLKAAETYLQHPLKTYSFETLKKKWPEKGAHIFDAYTVEKAQLFEKKHMTDSKEKAYTRVGGHLHLSWKTTHTYEDTYDIQWGHTKGKSVKKISFCVEDKKNYEKDKEDVLSLCFDEMAKKAYQIIEKSHRCIRYEMSLLTSKGQHICVGDWVHLSPKSKGEVCFVNHTFSYEACVTTLHVIETMPFAASKYDKKIPTKWYVTKSIDVLNKGYEKASVKVENDAKAQKALMDEKNIALQTIIHHHPTKIYVTLPSLKIKEVIKQRFYVG